MGVSKEKIINASIDILARKGAAGLTMRAVADELNVKAASLYWHVKDKRELYGIIAEHICSQVKMSASLDEPKKYLYELNTKFRTLLLEIRDSVEIFNNSEGNTPARIELTNNMLECLSKTGVRDENCMTAYNMLFNYVLSFVAEEVRFKSSSPEAKAAIAERFVKWHGKSMFYYESQFLYGLEALFAGFKSVSPSK